MYCITEQQIAYILNDIRRNGVETEDLQLNLLDHICCILEQTLKEDDDFERFYHQTIKQFYRKELREIEEETINLLTFKNYYSMKKIMMASGAMSAAALVAGSCFKVMHWPGAAVLLTLGIVLVSLVFLPVMAVLKVREVKTIRDRSVTALGTVLGILYAMSTLFAVMHWPGRTMLWLSTVGFSAFIFIPVYFFTGIRSVESRVNTLITSVLLVGGTALLFTMIGLSPVNRQTEIQVSNYLQNEQLLHKMQRNSPEMVAGKSELGALNADCEQLKTLIVQHETGQATIPADFAERKIVLNEPVGSKLENDAAAKTLFSRINAGVRSYNDHVPADNRLPQSKLVMDMDEAGAYPGITLLGAITQLQMYMASTTAVQTVTMK